MNILINILVWLVFLSVVAGLIIYVSKNIANVFELTNVKMLYLFFTLVTIGFMVSTGMSTNIDNLFFIAFSYLTTGLFILLFGMIFVSAFYQAANLFLKMQPSTARIFILVSLTLFVSFTLWKSYTFNVKSITVPIAKLDRDVTFVHLTDIHLGHFRGAGYLDRIVDETLKQDPEFVLITGDILDSGADSAKELLAPLGRIDVPVYYTYGNHEVYAGLEKILEVIKSLDVKILQNEAVVQSGLRIVGLNYMNADSSSFDMHTVNTQTIKETLPQIEITDDIPNIMMHHGPQGIKYANQHNIDLIVAGHTHGGQVFPFTLMAAKTFPYNKGLHNFNGTSIYVSQGAGTFLLPIRLGTENEITKITLTRN